MMRAWPIIFTRTRTFWFLLDQVLDTLGPTKPAGSYLSVRKVTPLYTSATYGNNTTGGSGTANKFFGSYLIKLKRR